MWGTPLLVACVRPRGPTSPRMLTGPADEHSGSALRRSEGEARDELAPKNEEHDEGWQGSDHGARGEQVVVGDELPLQSAERRRDRPLRIVRHQHESPE